MQTKRKALSFNSISWNLGLYKRATYFIDSLPGTLKHFEFSLWTSGSRIADWHHAVVKTYIQAYLELSWTMTFFVIFCVIFCPSVLHWIINPVRMTISVSLELDIPIYIIRTCKIPNITKFCDSSPAMTMIPTVFFRKKCRMLESPHGNNDLRQ